MKLPVILLGMILWSFAGNAQQCRCDYFHVNLFTLKDGNKIAATLCGSPIDSYKKDRVIMEFFVCNRQTDSMMINAIHNEEAAFLFRPTKDGFSLTQIIESDGKDHAVPATLEVINYHLKNGIQWVSNSTTPSKAVLLYLKKFKQYQKVK